MKLGDAISQYLLCCKVEKQLSEKTISAYKNDLKQFLVFCNKSELNKLSDIEREQLRLYIRRVIEKYKPKSQRRKIASVKALFNWLEYEELIEITPFRKIRIKINEGNRLPKTIPMAELKKLFGYIETGTHACSDFLLLRNTALFELMFATGLRVGEISDLLYENVDISSGTIRIIGKGDKERLIPLCNKEALRAIKKYLKVRN
ncbi:MAG: tyrosine-type recombinase/integrase, partial [Deferribacterales bacterium]